MSRRPIVLQELEPERIEELSKFKSLHKLFAAKGFFEEEIEAFFVLNSNLYDFDEKDENGLTPLLKAAALGKTAIFERLLERRDVDIAEVDDRGNNCLHLLVKNFDKDALVLQYFIALVASRNANLLDAVNNFGDTALHVAAEVLNYEAVELLVRFGANIYVKNAKNLNVIEVFKKIREDFKLRQAQEELALMATPQASPAANEAFASEATQSENDDDEFAMFGFGGYSSHQERMEAATKSSEEALQILLNATFDDSKVQDEQSEEWVVSEEDDANNVAEEIKNDATFVTINQIEERHKKIAGFIRKNKSQGKDKIDREAFYSLVKSSPNEKIDLEGNNALLYEVKFGGDVENMMIMLDNGVDLYAKNSLGEDVFSLNKFGKFFAEERENHRKFVEAVRLGDLKTVKEFLDLKIVTPRTIVDENKNTPMHIAAKEARADVMKMLFDYGATIEDRHNADFETVVEIVNNGAENFAPRKVFDEHLEMIESDSLYYAAKGIRLGDVEAISRAVNNETLYEVDKNGNSLLHFVAYQATANFGGRVNVLNDDGSAKNSLEFVLDSQDKKSLDFDVKNKKGESVMDVVRLNSPRLASLIQDSFEARWQLEGVAKKRRDDEKEFDGCRRATPPAMIGGFATPLSQAGQALHH